ncbi:MAG: glutamyl-tRNA reductase [Chloroflexota bacterium]
MDIYGMSITYQTAPLDLRQRFACPVERQADLLVERPGLDEYAILSTCNRLEVYAVGARGPVLALLEEIGGIPLDKFAAHVAEYRDRAAAEHLCRVAAGLESLVLGEAQILGQVATSLETARQRGRLGDTLTELFCRAIRAGKRAHNETAIGRNPTSIGSLAVRLAEQAAGSLSKANAVVVGAGEMAGLAAQALRKRRIRQLTIVNRTLARGLELAERVQGQAWPLERLEEALCTADVVIACTGAPYPLITPDTICHASRERSRPLVLIDIAVPRNISHEVASLPNILYDDLDTLKAAQRESLELRKDTIPQVAAIVDEEVTGYEAWQRQQDIIPIVAGLHAQAQAICKAEIERSLRRWPHAGEAERQRLDALTHAVIKRFLHGATHHLKNATSEQAGQYAVTLEALFALDRKPDAQRTHFSGR